MLVLVSQGRELLKSDDKKWPLQERGPLLQNVDLNPLNKGKGPQKENQHPQEENQDRVGLQEKGPDLQGKRDLQKGETVHRHVNRKSRGQGHQLKRDGQSQIPRWGQRNLGQHLETANLPEGHGQGPKVVERKGIHQVLQEADLGQEAWGQGHLEELIGDYLCCKI